MILLDATTADCTLPEVLVPSGVNARVMCDSGIVSVDMWKKDGWATVLHFGSGGSAGIPAIVAKLRVRIQSETPVHVVVEGVPWP